MANTLPAAGYGNTIAPMSVTSATDTSLVNPSMSSVSASVNPMVASITEAMVAAHPELAAVRALYLKGDYAGALNALYTTQFYQNTSSQVFANQQLKTNQKGVYDQTIANEWLPILRKYAMDNGLVVNDASLKAIAETAFDKGLTPTSAATLELFQGKDASGQNYVTSISGGVASQSITNLSAANADYGAGFGQDWIQAAAKSVAEGLTTEQYWTDQIKQQAIGSNPAWADQLNAGMTLKQIASPYINAYSNILGIDPASITMSDSLLKQGLQGTDPTKPSAMPLWQFEQQVRKDPRWATSKDAMDSLSNVGYTLAKEWGLMS